MEIKYPIVCVHWLDSYVRDDWQTPSEAKEQVPSHCMTVGFLIIKSKEKVIIASGKSEGGNLSSTWAIPRACVKKIQYLTPKEG